MSGRLISRKTKQGNLRLFFDGWQAVFREVNMDSRYEFSLKQSAFDNKRADEAADAGREVYFDCPECGSDVHCEFDATRCQNCDWEERWIK